MLKEVSVSATFFPKDTVDSGFLISTESEFCEYFQIQEDKLLQDFSQAQKSGVASSQWDHIYGLLGFGTNIAKINGGSPIIEASKILNQKQVNILKMIYDGKVVFINGNGGYHQFKHETHKILSSKNYKFNKEDSVLFAKKPTLLNLENDPQIENHTKSYFSDNNIDVSYICNLREFKKNELTELFNDFKLKGGHGVYVYTTGNDINQMFEYIDAIIESKLNTLIIKLSADNRDELKPVFEYAKKNIKYFSLL